MSKYLKIVLKKMCEFVGADFNEINFSDDFWYEKFFWTYNEENHFKEWLYKYLKNNNLARKELMKIPSKNSDLIKKFIDDFVFEYGWKYKL